MEYLRIQMGNNQPIKETSVIQNFYNALGKFPWPSERLSGS
jgi:hypothetical protein